MQNTLADITFKMHRSTLRLAGMSLLNINSSHVLNSEHVPYLNF